MRRPLWHLPCLPSLAHNSHHITLFALSLRPPHRSSVHLNLSAGCSLALQSLPSALANSILFTLSHCPPLRVARFLYASAVRWLHCQPQTRACTTPTCTRRLRTAHAFPKAHIHSTIIATQHLAPDCIYSVVAADTQQLLIKIFGATRFSRMSFFASFLSFFTRRFFVSSPRPAVRLRSVR